MKEPGTHNEAELRVLLGSTDWRDRYRGLEGALSLPPYLRTQLASALVNDENEYVRRLAQAIMSDRPRSRRPSRRALISEINEILDGARITHRQRQRLLELYQDVERAGALSFLGLAADRASRLVTNSVLTEGGAAELNLQLLETFLRHIAVYAAPEPPSQITSRLSSILAAVLEGSRMAVDTAKDGAETIVNRAIAHGVLRELLSNANDAAAKSGSIETYLGNSHVRLLWRHDGEPIVSDIADEIFEPWFTTRVGHAGLGLSLARNLADEDGGSVRLLSPDPVTFEVSLLVRPDEASRFQP